MAYSANVIEVNEASFQKDVIQKSNEKPVIVDFWAAWCGPCRMLGPVLERLADEPGSGFLLAKVDVDANPGLAMRYGVQGIPAVKAFVDGQIVGDFVGAQPEPMVRQFIQGIVPSEDSKEIKSAESMVADRQWEKAEELYRQLLEEEPGNINSTLGLARSLLGQGKGCMAVPYLEGIKHDPTVMDSVERLLVLAHYLCFVSKQNDELEELTIVEAQYRQSARLFSNGNYSAALDGLLEVLRYNKNYRNGEAKGVMLGIFELFGDNDPLTIVYRRDMASVLF